MITEGDIARMAAGFGGLNALAYTHEEERHHELRQSVGEIMTRNVVTAEEATPAREIARLMNRHGVKRIPIMHGSEIVGIVTRADILGLFDRAPGDVASDVRRALRDDLMLDTSMYSVDVHEGVVSLHGPATTSREAHLIETIVSEVDGVVGVDTSGLSSDTSIPA